MESFDLLVIGGGVNGAGIARDAAGRGLRVLLLEAEDLAGATSSSSSKLIHGGLRYLEHGEFRLVREALAERAVLLRIAPHISWPMRFVLPVGKERPAWLLRAGLFLYDHLGWRPGAHGTLPGTRRLDLRRAPEGGPLDDRFRVGFEYSDAWVDDARLVVLNAVDAAGRGAAIRTRCRCTGLRAEDGGWVAGLEDGTEIRARAVANAAGPWVADVLRGVPHPGTRLGVRMVKGSHIVVPRLYDGPHAFILQNDDKRIVFVLPYEQDFSLIGTTDVPYEGDPRAARIDDAEVEYLCRAVSRSFRRPVRPGDMVHSFSGVRPLQDDGAANASAVTRDYKLHMEESPAPMLSVFGGKITTYRRLAEHAMALLAPVLGMDAPAWTAGAPLPGGDMPDFSAFLAEAQVARPWMDPAALTRLAHAYGTRLDAVLGGAPDLAALGEHFGAGLFECELRYLARHEWARTGEDVLWRRTKLGLRLDGAQRARVAAWMEANNDA